jgi:tetratricopeptide (TPR) repeat protein
MSNFPTMKCLKIICATILFGTQIASCQPSPTPKALYSQAYEKTKVNSYQSAIVDLDRAIALDSTFAEAYLLRGKIKVALGQSTEACKDAKKAADLGNKEAALICQQYCQVMTEEQVAVLIRPDDSLAKLYPNRPEPLYNISNVYFDARQYQKAIEYCNKAIAADSTYAPAYYNKGVCLLNLNDKVKGCLLIKKAAGMGYDVSNKLKSSCDAILSGN